MVGDPGLVVGDSGVVVGKSGDLVVDSGVVVDNPEVVVGEPGAVVDDLGVLVGDPGAVEDIYCEDAVTEPGAVDVGGESWLLAGNPGAVVGELDVAMVEGQQAKQRFSFLGKSGGVLGLSEKLLNWKKWIWEETRIWKGRKE